MLTKEQLEDLAQLQTVAEHFDAEVAIIGAAALHCFVDLDRFTLDVDLAVALDLEDFAFSPSNSGSADGLGNRAENIAGADRTAH